MKRNKKGIILSSIIFMFTFSIFLTISCNVYAAEWTQIWRGFEYDVGKNGIYPLDCGKELASVTSNNDGVLYSSSVTINGPKRLYLWYVNDIGTASAYVDGVQTSFAAIWTDAIWYSYDIPFGTHTVKIEAQNGPGWATYIHLYQQNSSPMINASMPANNKFMQSNNSINISGTVKDIDTANYMMGSSQYNYLSIYYRVDGTNGQAGTKLCSDITANGTNQSFNGSVPLNSVTEGNHTLYTWVDDNRGGKTAESDYAFLYDTKSPTADSIIINNGDKYADKNPLVIKLNNVKDNISTKDKIKIFVSTTDTKPLATDSNWSSFDNTNDVYEYNYSGAKQDITLYAWLMDEVGNISDVLSDSITIGMEPLKLAPPVFKVIKGKPFLKMMYGVLTSTVYDDPVQNVKVTPCEGLYTMVTGTINNPSIDALTGLGYYKVNFGEGILLFEVIDSPTLNDVAAVSFD